MNPRFFIAGIIQGSLPDAIHPQGYRREIADLLLSAFPGATIFDPVEKYPDSLSYDEDQAKTAFFDLMDLAGKHDVLIAFIPQASMGTAIELWRAHHASALVIAVSGLRQNWAIKFLSDAILEDIPALKDFITNGKLAETMKAKAQRKPKVD